MLFSKEKRNILFLIFNIIFILTISFLTHFALFKPFNNKLSVPVILCTLIILFVLFLAFCFISKNFTKKQLLIVSGLNLFIFILLQIIFGYFFAVNPGWDVKSIYSSASSIALNKTEFLSPYFSKLYPNNAFIAICWSFVYKVCITLNINFILISIIINIFSVLAAVLITYYLIKEIFNLRVATLSSFLFLLVTPFYSYSPIFYTDTLTMLFLPLAFLLVYKFKMTNNYLNLILCSIIIAVGKGIKTNIVIGFIALTIYLFLSTKKFKEILKCFSAILIPFLISSVIISSICQSYINVPLKEAGLPYTHWVMMGLSDKGGFNKKDVDASKAHGPNKEDIESFNIATIKSRLKNYGISGYSKFLYKKLQYTWGEGTYFAPVKLSRNPIKKFKIHDYIYGDKNIAFNIFSEATHSLLLILIAIGSLSLFKSKKNIGFLFNITIFGTFLFLMLWETRSRYLVCILPLMVCSASFGINYIITTFNIFKSKTKIVQPLNSK